MICYLLQNRLCFSFGIAVFGRSCLSSCMKWLFVIQFRLRMHFFTKIFIINTAFQKTIMEKTSWKYWILRNLRWNMKTITNKTEHKNITNFFTEETHTFLHFILTKKCFFASFPFLVLKDSWNCGGITIHSIIILIHIAT